MAKIVIYHPTFAQVRGAELIIRNLAAHLAVRNEVCVISHDEGPVGIPGTQHISIKTDSRGFNFINNLAFSREIQRKMDVIPYDILLTSNAPPIIDYVISRKRKRRALHYCWCHEPRRSIFFDEFGSSSFIKYEGIRPRIRIPIYKKLYMDAFRNHYDKIIVYSRYIGNIMMRMGVSQDKIVEIPWGIDTEKIIVKPIEETRRILYVGAIHWIKNVYRLMEAMKIVTQSFKDSRLTIAGPILENEEERFKEALTESEGVVEYLGVKTGSDLDELYRSSQIVAYPTIDEPWGLVPIEGMAQGRPTIVGTGGPRETILDGLTGFHVDPLKVNEIAGAIMRLLGDFGLCRKMGTEGRERAVRNYDISRSYEIVDKVFSV